MSYVGRNSMNRPKFGTREWAEADWGFMRKVELVTQDEFIRDLYDEFKDNPKVKWKESIKKVLGLPDEEGVA